MENIKFRIVKDNKKVVGYERLTEKGWEWMYLELNPDHGERWTQGTLLNYGYNLKRCQFIGRLDKNGNEIYVGDILSSNKGDVLFTVYFGENSFDSSLASFCFKGTRGGSFPVDYSISTMSVIGNIFENKEILTHTNNNTGS